jgi:hypothetical protein
MMTKRFAVALVVCALAGLSATVVFAAEEEESGKPGALPRKGKHDHHKSHKAPEERAAEPESDTARMSRSPAPVSGSMPKGAAPGGKLGTEPTARGRLGTDPKPGESSDRPPRFN